MSVYLGLVFKMFRRLLLAKRMEASYANKYGNFIMGTKNGMGVLERWFAGSCIPELIRNGN